MLGPLDLPGGDVPTEVLQSQLLLVPAVVYLVEGALLSVADSVVGEVDATQEIDVVRDGMANDETCGVEYVLHVV